MQDHPLLAGEVAQQGGERFPRLGGVLVGIGENLPRQRLRVRKTQEERHQRRSCDRRRDAGKQRRHGEAELVAGGLVEVPAPGDLDLGEAGEIPAFLETVEVEGQDEGLGLGRGLQQPGAAAAGLAGQNQHRRRARCGKQVLDRGEGLE